LSRSFFQLRDSVLLLLDLFLQVGYTRVLAANEEDATNRNKQSHGYESRTHNMVLKPHIQSPVLLAL
jgi:hypothetical protein